jgi:hypothetical protein
MILLWIVNKNIFFCKNSNVVTQYKTSCFSEATATDSTCEEDIQCNTPFPNSECSSTKCKCKDTHVANTDKNKCLASKLKIKIKI